MPLRQYAYFALISERTSAAEMTAFLGIEPDEVLVRGSRRTKPTVIPATHRWKVVCRAPSLRVDEQIARVVDRLTPHTQRIAELSARLSAEDASAHSRAVLEVVRYFNDDTSADGAGQEQAAEAPNLFGWHLDRAVLDFLTATGAVLDVDEYDMTLDPADRAPEDPAGRSPNVNTWATMSEREYFATVGRLPGMFMPEVRYRSAIAFLCGYDQCATRRGGSWFGEWEQWLRERAGETGSLGWVAHVPMLVAPDAPRNVDKFNADQEAQVVAGLFRLIDGFLAERDSKAEDTDGTR